MKIDFQRIKSIGKDRNRTSQTSKITQRLEKIDKRQDEIGTAIASIQKTQETELERMRPSPVAWMLAAMLFGMSSGLLIVAIGLSVWLSSTEQQAVTLNEEVQTLHEKAITEIVAYQQPFAEIAAFGVFSTRKLPAKELQSLQGEAKKGNSYISSAENALDQADSAVSTLNADENSFTILQLITQMALGFASAFFGAVLGWIITQVLTEIHWRKKANRDPLTSSILKWAKARFPARRLRARSYHQA